jgi:hypothetical protein
VASVTLRAPQVTPQPVVILVPVPVAPGDRGVFKKIDYRRHKALRPNDAPWPVKQGIPSQLDRETLRRRVQKWRDANRARVEEMLTEARMKLAA